MDARVGGQTSLNSAASHGTAVASQPRKQQQQHLDTVSQLLAGAIPGAVSKTCTAPLSRLTILAQVQGMRYDVSKMSKPCIWREAKRIVAEEGFRAFWKGNLVTVAHRLPYSSVNFYAYERYKSILDSIFGVESNRENFCVGFLGGGLAGVTAASAVYPLDLVRARLACQTNVIYYRGIGHTLSRIVREEGVLGLYKGLGASLLEVGPNRAISFSVYESLKSRVAVAKVGISIFGFFLHVFLPIYYASYHHNRPQDSTFALISVCGALSGIASSTATFPIDLVRRRMQLEGAGGHARVYNTGLFGAFKQIMKQEGLRGFYRGILTEYCKVVPSAGITFMTYETMKILLACPPKEA